MAFEVASFRIFSKVMGKKRKKKVGGGGAFGSSKKKSDARLLAEYPEDAVYLRIVQEMVAEQDFETDDEIEAFVALVMSRPREEIIEEFHSRVAPIEDLSIVRALQILGEITDLKDMPQMRKKAKAALEESRECYEAWQVLALSQSKPSRAIAIFEEGVAVGRVALAEFLPVEGEVGNSWRHQKARPFLELFAALGSYYLIEEKWKKAAATFLEILRLNRHDNQGIREKLYPVLFQLRDYEKISEVLAWYPGDFSLSSRVAHVLIPLLKFVDGLHHSLKRNPEKLIGTEKHLWRLVNESYPELDGLMKKLQARNFFVCNGLVALTDLDFELPEQFRMGGLVEMLRVIAEYQAVPLDSSFEIAEWLWLVYPWKQIPSRVVEQFPEEIPLLNQYIAGLPDDHAMADIEAEELAKKTR